MCDSRAHVSTQKMQVEKDNDDKFLIGSPPRSISSPRAAAPAWAGVAMRLRPVENFAASRIAKVASGGAWYHEEAVQSAERVRKI